jgi:hypothetical protein
VSEEFFLAGVANGCSSPMMKVFVGLEKYFWP